MSSMNVTAIESHPLWLESPRPEFGALPGPAQFDVAVIGGGITGLTSAYLLKQAGKRVAVFEKEKICGGETGHTTAHLVYMTDLRLAKLVSTFGKKNARTVWWAGKVAIDLIEEIIDRESIDCGFQRVPGFVHAALFQDRDETDELREEAKLARELGFEATYQEHIPVKQKPGVRYEHQALFDPVAYLSGLAKLIPGDGCEIYEHSEMTEAKDDHPTIRVQGYPVQIDKLVIATHVPLIGLNGIISATALQTKLYGYSTYVVGGRIPAGSLPYGSYNDTDNPYHYLRIFNRDGQDYAIFGGEDHKTGQVEDNEKRYVRLEQQLTNLIPGIMVDRRWSGQVVETNDGLPYIGPANDKQFIASGYSGNGMTFGTMAALMACDWVTGRKNSWSDLFSLNRKKILGGTWDYIMENKDFPYEFIKGYLQPASHKSLDSIKVAEGKMMILNGQRRAVFRDADGAISNCSAICTHMGCVVQWNAAEQTWDCPCHGSRFSTTGHVLAGPAETPLSTEET